VSKDNGESTFGVLAGKSVGICVADTSVVDLDSDLAGLGSGNLNVLNGQVLASLPGDGSLQVIVFPTVSADIVAYECLV